jgi:hypothetical protein
MKKTADIFPQPPTKALTHLRHFSSFFFYGTPCTNTPVEIKKSKSRAGSTARENMVD